MIMIKGKFYSQLGSKIKLGSINSYKFLII